MRRLRSWLKALGFVPGETGGVGHLNRNVMMPPEDRAGHCYFLYLSSAKHMTGHTVDAYGSLVGYSCRGRSLGQLAPDSLSLAHGSDTGNVGDPDKATRHQSWKRPKVKCSSHQANHLCRAGKIFDIPDWYPPKLPSPGATHPLLAFQLPRNILET